MLQSPASRKLDLPLVCYARLLSVAAIQAPLLGSWEIHFAALNQIIPLRECQSQKIYFS